MVILKYVDSRVDLGIGGLTMVIEEVFKRGREYPLNFFYGDIKEMEKKYEFPGGLFVLGENGEERELFWGVDTMDNLKGGLKRIREENDDFIFRYAGKLDDVIKNTKVISDWGYHIKSTYVGYFLEVESKDFYTEDMQSIEKLEEKDLREFLRLERSIFDFLNVSKEELNEWIQNEDYMVLGYKIGGQIKGFAIIKIYGDEKEWCFLRNLGVAEEERGKGIGETLMRSGLKLAKDRGIKKSMLWVDINNKGARRLYEKIGYKLDENESETVFSTVE